MAIVWTRQAKQKYTHNPQGVRVNAPKQVLETPNIDVQPKIGEFREIRIPGRLSLENVSQSILAYYAQIDKGGWREVGKHFGITAGMAYQIAKHGYEPKTSRIRTQLKLSIKRPKPVKAPWLAQAVANLERLLEEKQRKESK